MARWCPSRIRRCAWLLAILLLVPLSGCLQRMIDIEEPLAPLGPIVDTTPHDDVLYVDDGWALEPDPGNVTEGRTGLGDFYTAWANGGPFPEFSSEPVDRAIQVTGPVDLELHLTVDLPVTSTPGIFPDFVLYFGTTAAVMADASPATVAETAASTSVLLPGQTVTLTATLELPDGGIIVPAGEGIRVVTAPVMMETDLNDLYVLHTAANPSQVRYTWQNVTEAPWETVQADPARHRDQLIAGTFLHGQEQDGTNVKHYPVEVNDRTVALLVDMAFTGGTPFPDMDLYVLAPDGETVARSVTPGDTESVHLYLPNLNETGTYQVKIVNYVTVNAPYSLAIRVRDLPSSPVAG